jgi:hypothetical protein
MIQTKLATFAESVVRDTETNSISIFNMIEELNASEFPVLMPKLSVFFLVERTDEERKQYDAVIDLNLDEQHIGQASMSGDFEGKLRTRIILVIQGIVIEHPGRLTAKLTLNGDVISELGVVVQRAEPTLPR